MLSELYHVAPSKSDSGLLVLSITVFQSSYYCLFQFKIIKKHLSCILATCLRSWHCVKTGYVQKHRFLCWGKTLWISYPARI